MASLTGAEQGISINLTGLAQYNATVMSNDEINLKKLKIYLIENFIEPLIMKRVENVNFNTYNFAYILTRLGELKYIDPGEVGVSEFNLEIQNKLRGRHQPVFTGQKGKVAQQYFPQDKVMQINNDYELGVMNGEVGTVISGNEEGLLVSMNGGEVVYPEDKVENLNLAYATTIHKSQGSEYSAVILPVSKANTRMISKNGK